MPFNIGSRVRIKEGAVVYNPFPGDAIFRGKSNTSSIICYALERLDGNKDGGAQNSWWNFLKEDVDKLELVEIFDWAGTSPSYEFSERIKDSRDLKDKISTLSLTTRTMQKLSELSATVRRALSPEQRKLYKAGFIDSCGKYTNVAKDEVLNVLCDEHKAKLVEFAAEAIETAKEDKEDDE